MRYLLCLVFIIAYTSCKEEISLPEHLIKKNLALTSPNNDWSKVESQSAKFELKTIINGNVVSNESKELSQKFPRFQKMVSTKKDVINNIIITKGSESSMINFKNAAFFGISSIPKEKISISPVIDLMEKKEDYTLIDSIWNGEPSYFVMSEKYKDSYVFDKNSSHLIAYLSESGYGKSTTTYSDYQEADGFILPFKKTVSIEEAAYLQDYTYQSRSMNITFPPNHFDLDEKWKPLGKGTQIPDFNLPMVFEEKKMVSSADIMGKITLIDFWATWCKPCIEEFPIIEQQYKAFKSKGFQVVSISVDKSIDAPKSYLSKKPFPWDYSLFLEGGFESDLAESYQLVSIPKPILINEQGEIIAVDAELRNGKLESVLKEVFSGKTQ